MGMSMGMTMISGGGNFKRCLSSLSKIIVNDADSFLIVPVKCDLQAWECIIKVLQILHVPNGRK